VMNGETKTSLHEASCVVCSLVWFKAIIYSGGAAELSYSLWLLKLPFIKHLVLSKFSPFLLICKAPYLSVWNGNIFSHTNIRSNSTTLEGRFRLVPYIENQLVFYII